MKKTILFLIIMFIVTLFSGTSCSKKEPQSYDECTKKCTETHKKCNVDAKVDTDKLGACLEAYMQCTKACVN